LTTRGLKEQEMVKVAEWCIRVREISVRLQQQTGKKLADFLEAIHTDVEVKKVCEEVKTFARQYSIPGL